MNVDPGKWRPSQYTDGPNESGYFTAGLDVPKLDIFGKPDWHYHAIQIHSKNQEEAEHIRNLLLARAWA